MAGPIETVVPSAIIRTRLGHQGGKQRMSLTRRDLLSAGCAVSASSLLANSPVHLVQNAVAKKKDRLKNSEPFQPTWSSLRSRPSPQWLRDSKFGIYTHWGVYSVHGVGKNVTWY